MRKSSERNEKTSEGKKYQLTRETKTKTMGKEILKKKTFLELRRDV